MMGPRHPDGGFSLHLTDYVVSRCIVDFAFTLHLSKDGDEAFLRIESPFDSSMDGATHHCDPEYDPQGLGYALAHLHGKVSRAEISGTGGIHVTFENGGDLTVSSDPKFEAWTFSQPNGLLIVSMPSGGVAIFSAYTPTPKPPP